MYDPFGGYREPDLSAMDGDQLVRQLQIVQQGNNPERATGVKAALRALGMDREASTVFSQVQGSTKRQMPEDD